VLQEAGTASGSQIPGKIQNDESFDREINFEMMDILHFSNSCMLNQLIESN
jgi:hypothetical protein